MTVIICVDNNGGILFNGKRQSKDRIFRKYLLDIVEKKMVALQCPLIHIVNSKKMKEKN